jgi:hypothetical protein
VGTAPARPHRLVVVAGGQTGVDRAALDAAIALGVEYRGWCPKGGWAEDLTEPPGLLALYPGLSETDSADPAERTRLNVRDSDATIVIAPGTPTGGTALAIEAAQIVSRPVLRLRPDPATDGLRSARDFLAAVRDRRTPSLGPDGSDVLAVSFAGPRESESPGIYRAGRALAEELLKPPSNGAPDRLGAWSESLRPSSSR